MAASIKCGLFYLLEGCRAGMGVRVIFVAGFIRSDFKTNINATDYFNTAFSVGQYIY